ncbi:MAG TPA: tetratricopeptide repeat protein [Candidatus Polarisedimenticolaceae bacterium]
MRTVVLFVIASAVSQLLGGAAHRDTEKGNAKYEAKDWKAAREAYDAAAQAAPNAPELPYNLGNVAFREDDVAQAAELYEKALRQAGSSLLPRAAHNLGNALFRQERYEDAVRAYRRALQVEPKDLESKRNLELAQRALQVQKQKQEQQQQKQEQQQPPRQDQEQQPQQGGESKDKPEPKPSQGSEPKPGDDEKPDPRPQPKPRPGDMSPSQAEQLLDRLAEIERQNQRKKKDKGREVVVGSGTPEKDW